MLYDVNASLKDKFLYLNNICVFDRFVGLGVFKGALALCKDGEGPSHLPHNSSNGERTPARTTTTIGTALGCVGRVQS